MSAKAFSPAEEVELVRRYRDGESAPKLALAMGRSKHAVLSTLNRHGVVMRHQGGSNASPFTDQLIDEIVTKYQAGQSQTVLARLYGMDQTRISRALNARGITGRGLRGGQQHARWKGGIITVNGYRFVLMPRDSPFRRMVGLSPYVAEHRLVVATHLGRPLHRWETVHHINGDRLDNRLENLQLRVRNHGVGVALKCADCSSTNLVPIELAH